MALGVNKEEANTYELMDTKRVMFPPRTADGDSPWYKQRFFCLASLLLAFSYLLIITLFVLVFLKASSHSSGSSHGYDELNQSLASHSAKLSRLSSDVSSVRNELKQIQATHQLELSRLSSGLNNVQNKLNETQRNRHTELFPCGTRSREWEYFDGGCYYYSIISVPWGKAQELCEAQNSHLVIINDLAEQNFLQSRTRNERYWLGLSDLHVEGQWRWVDGTLTANRFTKWTKGEPNDTGNEDCGQIDTAGEWNDVSCEHSSFYICEKTLPRTEPSP